MATLPASLPFGTAATSVVPDTVAELLDWAWEAMLVIQDAQEYRIISRKITAYNRFRIFCA